MLTQAMPVIINALRQAGGPWPLIPALGNCQQPLSHRGAVNLAAAPRTRRDGTFAPGAWNPSSYPGLLPSSDQGAQVNTDLADMGVNWNAGNQYDSQFYFPTNQFFAQNQFFGGPVVNIQNHAHIDYLDNDVFDGDTVNVNNFTAQAINGQQVPQVAGPQGGPGADGRPGAPGGIGFAGPIPLGKFREIQYLRGRNPRIVSDPITVARPHTYVSDVWLRQHQAVTIPTNAISGGTVEITPATKAIDIATTADISGGTISVCPVGVSLSIPTGVTFNPDTCAVSFSGYATVWVAGTTCMTSNLSGASVTLGGTTTVYVAGTTAISATISATAASTSVILTLGSTSAASVMSASVAAASLPTYGVVIAPEFTPTEDVDVTRRPRLVDVAPEGRIVLHK